MSTSHFVWFLCSCFNLSVLLSLHIKQINDDDDDDDDDDNNNYYYYYYWIRVLIIAKFYSTAFFVSQGSYLHP